MNSHQINLLRDKILLAKIYVGIDYRFINKSREDIKKIFG